MRKLILQEFVSIDGFAADSKGSTGFFEFLSGESGKEIDKDLLNEEQDIVELLSDITKIFPSRGEARKGLAANAVAVNKEKITADYKLTEKDLVLSKYILVQFGKNKSFVLTVK